MTEPTTAAGRALRMDWISEGRWSRDPQWLTAHILAIEAEARQHDASALREALERFIEEYGDDALGTRFTVNDIVEWLAALPPSAPQEPAREDEPEPTHPWDGMADGHNCASCGPESIWKCDRPAHPPRPAGRVMPTRAEYAVEAERIVDDLVLPPSAPPALDVESWTNALAHKLARARFGPGLDMGGKHNPLPSERQTARQFVDDLLARLQERDR